MKKSRFFMLLFVVLASTVAFKMPKMKMHHNATITIVNKYWASIHLQVRVGNYSDPLQNQLQYDGSLAQSDSKSFPVSAPNTVIYRRDANPNNPDGSHFTNWTFANCTSDCVIDNP
jgi:hypothetical protein